MSTTSTTVSSVVTADAADDATFQESGTGCEECNNPSDPITLEDFSEVPAEFIFKVREKNVVHCFDIRALHQYYDKCGKLENPLNRMAFSEETLDEFLKRIIQLGLSTEDEGERIRERRHEPDDDDEDEVEIITVFRHGDQRRHRHGRRRRWGNVSMSSAILEAMSGSGNPIARAVIDYGLDQDMPARRPPRPLGRRATYHRPPPPGPGRPTMSETIQRTERPQRTVAFGQSHQSGPPLKKQVSFPARPTHALTPHATVSGRDYHAHSIQHESLLAASRPGASGSRADSFSTNPSPLLVVDRPLPRPERPVLDSFYQGPMPQGPLQNPPSPSFQPAAASPPPHQPSMTYTHPMNPPRQVAEVVTPVTRKVLPVTRQVPPVQRAPQPEMVVEPRKVSPPKSKRRRDRGNTEWVLWALLLGAGALFLFLWFQR
uniref:Uncharacterized protein n=1 Tax=viral metagenome TaxID=1070528 RepID=A0A6C0BNA4_9ZZZZ